MPTTEQLCPHWSEICLSAWRNGEQVLAATMLHTPMCWLSVSGKRLPRVSLVSSFYFSSLCSLQEQGLSPTRVRQRQLLSVDIIIDIACPNHCSSCVLCYGRACTHDCLCKSTHQTQWLHTKGELEGCLAVAHLDILNHCGRLSPLSCGGCGNKPWT